MAGVETQAMQADTAILVAARDGFDLLAAAAHVVVVMAFLAVFAILVFLLWQLRSAKRALKELQRKVEAEPLVMRARSIAEHVEFMTRSVRKDVERLNDTVASVSDRVTQASDRMEERIEEFNALMEVIQSEAEETFVDTASTVRGFRTGAQRFRGDGRLGRGARRRSGRPRPADHGDGHPAGDPQQDPAAGSPSEIRGDRHHDPGSAEST